MNVLVIAPGKKPEVKKIGEDLEAMQAVVGGLIEAVYPFDDPVALVCNDEGKLMGLEYNRALRDSQTGQPYDVIAGTFFICGLTADSFASLPEELILKYTAMYAKPEVFLKLGKQLFVLPAEDQEDSQ